MGKITKTGQVQKILLACYLAIVQFCKTQLRWEIKVNQILSMDVYFYSCNSFMCFNEMSSSHYVNKEIFKVIILIQILVFNNIFVHLHFSFLGMWTTKLSDQRLYLNLSILPFNLSEHFKMVIVYSHILQ